MRNINKVLVFSLLLTLALAACQEQTDEELADKIGENSHLLWLKSKLQADTFCNKHTFFLSCTTWYSARTSPPSAYYLQPTALKYVPNGVINSIKRDKVTTLLIIKNDLSAT